MPMIRHNQDGAANGLLISLIVAVVLLIVAVAFGGWAFSSRSDYKNNTDAKINVAVQAAVQKESAAKDVIFAQQNKDPLKTYQGPEAYGSLNIEYPKTWSGYVDSSGSSGNAAIDAYFTPGVVPSITDPTSVFALRVQVLNQPYAQTLQSLSQQSSSPPTITAYSLPKLPKVVGVEVVGQLASGTDNAPTVTMVVLPLRSQTLEIYTSGSQYLQDFNQNILPNFSFSP
jgi:hypothetical protein